MKSLSRLPSRRVLCCAHYQKRLRLATILPMSLNHELSSLFSHVADLMDVKGENTFAVLAFRKVSRILKDMTFDVRRCVEDGTLCDVEGIGKSSQRIIEEYVKTGRSTDLEELRHSVPEGLIPLLQVEGLGPKTISLVWREKGVTNAEQLAAAIQNGALLDLKGMGAKKIEAIRKGLENLSKRAGRVGIGHALPVAQELVERLKQVKGVVRAEIAGSLRRMRETIGDVDLICCVKDPKIGEQITAAFVAFPGVERVLGQGTSKSSVVTTSGLQVDLRVLPEEHCGAAMLYFTGSKDHNVKMRGLAQKKGMTLNEWGLYKLKDYEKADKKTAEAPPIKPVASRTEQEIYEKLGMAYVEPELREDRGEFEASIENRLPKVIARANLR